MKHRLGASDRLYPMPCPLVVGGDMENAGTLAVAWIGIAGATPPSVAMALRSSRHTLSLLRESGDFTVNIPSTSLVTEVDYCGIVGGRDHDKFAEAGLDLEPSVIVSAPIISQCPYNMECRVTQEVDMGNYVLVIGEILETHADESVLDESGKMIDIEKLDPLIYIAGQREYRGVGPKIADAFEVGKSLRKKE